MGDRNERIAWFIQNTTVMLKKAQYITQINFTQPLLETMETTQLLNPTSHIDVQSLKLLTTEEEDQLCYGIGERGLKCYLFNHHGPDGRFFKMRLKFGHPIDESLGYHFVAPWHQVIAAGAIKADTCVHVYGYREGGLVVFVFVGQDLFGIKVR